MQLLLIETCPICPCLSKASIVKGYWISSQALLCIDCDDDMVSVLDGDVVSVVGFIYTVDDIH